MNNCATCKHWQGERIAGIKSCAVILVSHEEKPGSAAVIAGWDLHSAWLRTSPDFGCALWEAKP